MKGPWALARRVDAGETESDRVRRIQTDQAVLQYSRTAQGQSSLIIRYITTIPTSHIEAGHQAGESPGTVTRLGTGVTGVRRMERNGDDGHDLRSEILEVSKVSCPGGGTGEGEGEAGELETGEGDEGYLHIGYHTPARGHARL